MYQPALQGEQRASHRSTSHSARWGPDAWGVVSARHWRLKKPPCFLGLPAEPREDRWDVMLSNGDPESWGEGQLSVFAMPCNLTKDRPLSTVCGLWQVIFPMVVWKVLDGTSFATAWHTDPLPGPAQRLGRDDQSHTSAPAPLHNKNRASAPPGDKTSSRSCSWGLSCVSESRSVLARRTPAIPLPARRVVQRRF